MRILAGGPTRETESELFKLHRLGLDAQQGDFELTIRHDIVPDDTHARWHTDKIERVAKVRQGFMDAVAEPAVHKHKPKRPKALFMVDSDVILGPGVLERMLGVDADVVYGVFWTQADWAGQPERPCPQVWDINPYGWTIACAGALHADGVNEVPVYGGGACTLIRDRGFESHYWPLLDSVRPYSNMWAGEDRTYCLGLELRGIKQVAVTGLPITHCYHLHQQSLRALEQVRRNVGL